MAQERSKTRRAPVSPKGTGVPASGFAGGSGSGKLMTKIIKPLARGQITIPAEFRHSLGMDDATFLSLTLKGNKLEITPVVIREREEESSKVLAREEDELRDYSEDEIAAFLREDKIDKGTATRVRRLLAEGKL